MSAKSKNVDSLRECRTEHFLSIAGKCVCSSIYQDVPLYSLEEFKLLAPEEARTEEVLSDEHQLMLNRLSFELAERQRYAANLYHMSLGDPLIPCVRLDLRRKELLQQKEELLKESKTKSSTMDSVKTQIDQLIKVLTVLVERFTRLTACVLPRLLQTPGRK